MHNTFDYTRNSWNGLQTTDSSSRIKEASSKVRKTEIFYQFKDIFTIKNFF